MEWESAEPTEKVVVSAPAPAPVVRRAPVDSLVVGRADDPAEREADAIAARVMRSLADPAARPSPVDAGRPTRVRRMPAATIRRVGGGDDPNTLDEADPDGEDEALSAPEGAPATADPQTVATGTSAPPPGTAVARMPVREIRRAALPGSGADGGALDADTSARIQRSIGGGRPLDPAVRTRIQPAFRSDLSGVRVHADAGAAEVSRQINARAFTVGNDVFFGSGEYRPAANDGMELLAHELAHVEQQRSGTARRTVVSRRFQPSVTLSKAHLRAKDQWDTFVGGAIPSGTRLFVDDDPAERIVQRRRVLSDVTWVPAVNVDTMNPTAATGTQIGYIRSGRATPYGTIDKTSRRAVTDMLRTAEARVPGDAIKDQLTKAEHVDFLMDKVVRLDQWNPATGAKADTFGTAIGSLQAKYDRIREGAEHVADTLGYWRSWLFPDDPTLVDVVDVELLGSDLHEHGLGVMMVQFRKPPGGASMFSAQTVVDAVIKPEDKSLEKALLGAQSTSAANQVNQLAGLTGNQQLGTLKMEVGNIAPKGAQPVYSTLVERVKGKSSEKLAKEGLTSKGEGKLGVIPAFHETLVFAWLAGIDDLHWENVMWVNDVPYLIDADSAMSHEQMSKTGDGDKNQSGFSTFNKAESDASREGIKTLDAAKAKSKILDEMKKDTVTRKAILGAIKQAIAGHKGRTVPIYTQWWATKVRDGYQQSDAGNRDGLLDFYSTRTFLVGDNPIRANKGQGPGLRGTTGVNPDSDFYDQAAVKAQLKKDMEAAVIPFFEYHYDTGHVTYNGVKIFHGLTIDQSFDALTAKFG